MAAKGLGMRMKMTGSGVALLVAALLVSCGQASKEESLAKAVDLAGKGDARGATVHLKNAVEKDPNFFEARYELGKIYLDSGKYQQAETELAKVSMQSPDHGEIHYQLARLYINTKRYPETVREGMAHLAKFPGDARAMEVVARGYAVQEKHELGEKYFKDAIAADPSYAKARVNYARFLVSGGDYAKARENLAEALRRNPKETDAVYLLADISSSLGESDKALKIYEDYLVVVPEDQEALYRVGVNYFFKKDTAKLADAIARLGKVTTSDLNPDLALLEGLSSFAGNQYQQAVASLQKSSARKSRPLGEYFLGLALFRKGDFEQALSQFQRCLDQRPDAVKPRMMVAITLLKQGRREDALTAVKMILDKDPENPFAHTLAGDILTSMKRFDEAVSHYDKAGKEGDGQAQAMVKIGVARFRQGDIEAGEEALEEAVRIDPAFLESRITLASTLIKRKEYAKAATLLKKGLGTKGQDSIINSYLAQISLAQNKPKEAIQYLEAAKRAEPGFVEPYLNLASIYAAEGNYAKALAESEAAMAVAPANVELMTGVARLAVRTGDDAKALAVLTKAKDTGKRESHRPLLTFLLAKKMNDEANTLMDALIASRPTDPTVFEDKGRLLMQKGQYSEAAPYFDKVSALDPLRGQTLRVENAIASKKYQDAANAAGEAISANPSSPAGYLLLSKVSAAQNDFRGALDALGKASGQAAQDVSLSMAKGLLFERLGDPASAEMAYTSILRSKPDAVDARFALAALCERRGDRDRAEKLYREVLERAPNHPYALNNLALICVEQPAKADEALPLVLRSYKVLGDQNSVLDSIAYVLHKRGKNDKACQILEMVVTKGEKNPSILYHLGLVYNALGRKSDAIKTVSEAVKTEDFPEKTRAADLLASLRR